MISIFLFHSRVVLALKPNGTVVVSGNTVLKSMGLRTALGFENEATCLSSGCYSASLLLSGSSTTFSTAAAIPTCNVFLAPLRTTQLFCVKSSVMTKVSGTSNVTVPIFPAKPCYSVCEGQPHIKFDAIISEKHGYGWFGAYYAITPMIYGLDLSGASEAYNNRYSPGVLKGTEGANAVSAGTKFWGYDETVSICVPVQNYGMSTTTRSSSADNKINREEKQKGYFRENVPQLQAYSIPPSCFSIILSVPDTGGLLSPNFTYSNSWSIPDGKDYFSGTPYAPRVDFQFDISLSLKILRSHFLCVEDSINLH